MSGGKKKLSGKEKKMKRREELEREMARDFLVKAAYDKGNVLVDFQPFIKYDRNGLNVNLEYSTADSLTPELKSYITTLLKLNMSAAYGEKWPTAERDKRHDMVHPDARFILVREAHEVGNANGPATPVRCCSHGDAVCSGSSQLERSNETPVLSGTLPDATSQESIKPLWTGPGNAVVGFVEFRFLVEEGVVVLYVYELQLEERVRGCGLGKYLMQLMELIARKNGMKGVMLTVQKATPRAMDFYMKKLKYLILPISPSESDPMNPTSYEILGKIDAESWASLFVEE